MLSPTRASSDHAFGFSLSLGTDPGLGATALEPGHSTRGADIDRG